MSNVRFVCDVGLLLNLPELGSFLRSGPPTVGGIGSICRRLRPNAKHRQSNKCGFIL